MNLTMDMRFIIDKSILLHIFACLIITFFVGMILYFMKSPIITASLGGVITAFLCGITKEWTDFNSPKNYWNWGDILGNFIGCAIAVGILLLIWY